MLIDTDVLVWMTRGHAGAAARLQALTLWRISAVTYMELAQSCRDKQELARVPFEAETYEPETADQLVGKNGGALDRSLFSPIYKGDFSSQDERDIAVYLDGEAALGWWHRNVARNHYAVQGWRREKVYPDFIFAMQRGEVANRVVVLEVKGQHLAGNPDTEYKKAVLRLMGEAYDIEHTSRVGDSNSWCRMEQQLSATLC